jgi:hypothetical protein
LDRLIFIRSHALQRSVQREIGMDELEMLLDSKSSSASIQANGRIRIENNKIVAILQIDGDDLILITAFKV